MAKYLLSICISTNNVARWVIPAVRNIYSLGSDEKKFEVVIADNGDHSELESSVNEFYNHSNFRYVKTKAEGFYNIIENFVQARGDFMINLNHRSLLQKGAIEQIYEVGCKYLEQRPLIYFSNGFLKKNQVLEYETFNQFLNILSYRSSLSQGLFFWKEDLLNIPNIKFAKMSPNVSLLFDSKIKNKFVIDDRLISNEQDSRGKFGYDLFDTFAVHYLDLVNSVREEGHISKKTFYKIKIDVFKFLRRCYFDMTLLGHKGNYKLEGIKDSLSVYYSANYYFKMITYSYSIAIIKASYNKIFKFRK